ncbi:Intracellular sulfur oxidation protein, DsrE/DsrF family [Kushneria avicenniae]|uniref:Intracellular sulfur oxidation protein, DsrE/DsrF family n=1 Tax=Kushneria avicenniae TaxID=402385 RepID=A0A1I1IN49_9GAMM|nr:DsrE family protein [Kushneria avicenniae]SFC35718.1 Intracellular sulfur oxidation protein, DsrE/DsrF family [Kushneria avicenniae]
MVTLLKRYWMLTALVAAALLMVIFAAIMPRKPEAGLDHARFPAIEKFGGIADRHDTVDVPDPDKHYRVIFDVVSESDDPRIINPGLMRVARAVNVFADAGVPLENLEFVAIIHGNATRSVVNSELYEKWFGLENPNVALVSALKKAGVQVAVCGQVLSHWKIADSEVNDDIAITPSALSTLAIYGNEGYAYERL